jgi:hypothetical protein
MGMSEWSDAAQLHAAAVVDTFGLGPEPGLVQAAGDGVDLFAEGGDGPGVDHVVAGHDQTDGGIDRHHDGRIDRQQVRLAGLQFGLGLEERIECEVAVVGIFVGPEPLAAGRLDGEIRLRIVALQVEQPEGGDGDGDQDQDRHHGPGDLDGAVVGGPRRLGIGPGGEPHQGVDEKHEDEQ